VWKPSSSAAPVGKQSHEWGEETFTDGTASITEAPPPHNFNGCVLLHLVLSSVETTSNAWRFMRRGAAGKAGSVGCWFRDWPVLGDGNIKEIRQWLKI